MKNVIIIGTGGHAKVVTNIVALCADNLVGFLTSDTHMTSFLGKPVLGADTDYAHFSDCEFIVAIGNQYAREKIVTRMPDVAWYTAIHPSVIIPYEHCSIGEGTVISANAVINPYASIGAHCIINTQCVVEHDNTIGDFAHVSVGAMLAGNVHVGRRSWIGVGACVRNDICISDDCFVGAGVVVVKDLCEKGTYIGVPAQKLHKD